MDEWEIRVQFPTYIGRVFMWGKDANSVKNLCVKRFKLGSVLTVQNLTKGSDPAIVK